MGIDRQRTNSDKKFGLQELGVLNGPPVRAFSTIVSLTRRVQHSDISAFFVFDDETASIWIRELEDPYHPASAPNRLPLANSVASDVRSEGRTLCLNDLTATMPDASERMISNIHSIIASPVFGPAGEVVGVLAALSHHVGIWSEEQSRLQEELAHLLSDSIMLRASMETLRLIASERQPIY